MPVLLGRDINVLAAKAEALFGLPISDAYFNVMTRSWWCVFDVISESVHTAEVPWWTSLMSLDDIKRLPRLLT